mmetsp:Transcript_110716/g.220127  ORF Transcript_110716/g.220127 Transcript_110716/m.220127 type:complete len:193 (+) Transcript_110716:174-752(+)
MARHQIWGQVEMGFSTGSRSSQDEASRSSEASRLRKVDERLQGVTIVDESSETHDKSSNKKDNMLSMGSEKHASGECRPCHYVSTKAGCSKGAECLFCHMAHPKRCRPRPCKSKRQKCKELVSMMEIACETGENSFLDVAKAYQDQKGYLSNVIRSKLRRMQNGEEGEGEESSSEEESDDQKQDQQRVLVTL